MKINVLLLLVLFVAPATALDFTEDFEDDDDGENPEATFYTYKETSDAGTVSTAAPLGGTKSLKGNGTGTITMILAGPTQLSQFDFTVKGTTITDNGEGSQNVIRVQSQGPTRTMVEFFMFCNDAANPSGCSLRVRFQNVDTFGQVLVPASAGDSTFIIEITPNWTSGTFQLTVDSVDDGTFPFLELPSNIGKLTLGKSVGSLPMNLTFDDWFIDGATDAVASEESDISSGLQAWAENVHFSSTASLFLLGLVFFVIMFLAVAVPVIVVGADNTVIPALGFYATLLSLWLITMEWWPSWVALAAIILVSALISLVIRGLLMGIKDASTNAGIVAGALGYFIICTSLLGFSGYATDSIQIPTSSLETPDDVEAQTNMTAPQQSFAGAVTECLITFFSDCSRSTVSTTWATITDVASTIFNFARTAFTFLFQLLTFSLPVPVIFNTMIVLPPAAALATVGFSFVTRSGS